MKIYTVSNDVTNYRWAMPKDESVWQTNFLTFDGYEKKTSWKPISFYVDNPLLKKGNVIHIGAGVIAYDKLSVEKVAFHLEVSGELLPIFIDGEPYFLHNVTQVANALNQDETIWDEYEGVRTQINKFAFHKSRLSESSIFKIPETVQGDIYTFSGLKDPEDEFYYSYRNLGLEGLSFDEIYSD